MSFANTLWLDSICQGEYIRQPGIDTRYGVGDRLKYQSRDRQSSSDAGESPLLPRLRMRGIQFIEPIDQVVCGRPIPKGLQKDSGVQEGSRLSTAVTSVTLHLVDRECRTDVCHKDGGM